MSERSFFFASTNRGVSGATSTTATIFLITNFPMPMVGINTTSNPQFCLLQGHCFSLGAQNARSTSRRSSSFCQHQPTEVFLEQPTPPLPLYFLFQICHGSRSAMGPLPLWLIVVLQEIHFLLMQNPQRQICPDRATHCHFWRYVWKNSRGINKQPTTFPRPQGHCHGLIVVFKIFLLDAQNVQSHIQRSFSFAGTNRSISRVTNTITAFFLPDLPWVCIYHGAKVCICHGVGPL